MINTDTRQLRRSSSGVYTSGAGKTPCDHCGHKGVCPLDEREACEEFLPAIPFNDDTGMSAVFNTVRIGKAWLSRLNEGQYVALYNTITGEIIGYAIVLSVYAGPIDAMLRTHAHANHLMLDKDPSDAASTLHKWQLRQYGPRLVHEGTSITAIYLLRDHSATAEAVLYG